MTFGADIERLMKSKSAETRRIGILAHRYFVACHTPSYGTARPLSSIIAEIRTLLPHVPTCDAADAQSVTANLQRIADIQALYKQGRTACEARAIVEGREA